MKKQYKKPTAVFDCFCADSGVTGEIPLSEVQVLDLLAEEDITIDYATGNKLNSINYKDFVQ